MRTPKDKNFKQTLQEWFAPATPSPAYGIQHPTAGLFVVLGSC